ncbi:putative glycosyl hydrolase-like family 15 (GHL15) protein [Lentzea atacamensis]|uniref:Putative glycosyl hydrolase-like family 15 (GHL15) protein n=1 Tax=Lentzea atacamensis TaxID=531938 RepID=A0A316I2Q6_9PSEU|nr:putative glycoside hydrolase [Lentzea atacamensis]PWK81699.1 putative glycosyl hydrolase-like family 15 (GHL15) protein [Lentzea atacamensis]
MTDLGTSLHSWLEPVDPSNNQDWYEHVLSRNFACGCRPWTTYCTEWKPPSSGKLGTYWINWNSVPVDQATIEREARRRKYVMLNAWQGDLARKLKAVNPNLLVFCYKDASSTRSYDKNAIWSLLPAGVSYQWAVANRTDWFLKDSAGKLLSYSGYEGHWQMDIGNTLYQKMWAENVAKVKPLGFDGVLIDNLLWTPDTYHSGVYPAQYASKEAFQQAYVSFLANTRPVLTAAGLKTVGNLTDARRHSGGWNRYMAYLDGGWDEWWLAFSDTNLQPEYTEGWRRIVREVLDNEAAGKLTLVQPHYSNGLAGRRAFLYTLASYYCVAGPKSAITASHVTNDYDAPHLWPAEYDWDLGDPVKYYEWAAPNVFKRHFTKGMVVVNANRSDSGPVTIQLGGAYLDHAGATVTSVSLPGTSGAILRRVA